MKDDKPAKGFWLWVGIAFCLLGTAWTAFFIIASKNRVEEVPLEHRRTAVP